MQLKSILTLLLYSSLLIINSSAFAAPSLTFTYGENGTDIEEISTPEFNGFYSLRATLTEPLPRDIVFSFRLAGGSAEKLKDYSFPKEITGDISERAAGGPVILKAGKISVDFNIVQILDDIFNEPDETVIFSLFSSDVEITQNLAIITIVDNEKTPIIVLSAPGLNRNLEGGFDAAINEDDGGVALKLTLADEANRSSSEIIVKYLITQPEGISDIPDYSDPGLSNPPFIEGSLILPAEGIEKEFALAIFPDAVPENQETITFTLISAENAIIHDSRNFITITVNDDDANVGAINGTGVTLCYNDLKLSIPCDGSTGFPGYGQDGEQFTRNDFEKLNDTGNIMNSGASNAKCIRDKNTNLVWELKSDGGAYSWLNKIASVNGGDEGFEGSEGSLADVCNGNAPCNTEHYADVLNKLRGDTNNSVGLCNVTNWRLPKLRELMSIMDFQSDNELVLIDDTFFNVETNQQAGTAATFYWTASPAAVAGDAAWCVFFGKEKNNHIRHCLKTESLRARMVATCTPPLNNDGETLKFPDRPC